MKNEPCNNCVILPVCLGKSNNKLISDCKPLRTYIESQKGVVECIKEEEHVKAVEIMHKLKTINRSVKVTKYIDKKNKGLMGVYYMDDDKLGSSVCNELTYFD